MKNLLDAIKKHPNRFINTFLQRGETSPSTYNKTMHKLLAEKVKEEDWKVVKEKITEVQYYRALDGVVNCLNWHDYDEIFTIDEHQLILEFLERKELC